MGRSSKWPVVLRSFCPCIRSEIINIFWVWKRNENPFDWFIFLARQKAVFWFGFQTHKVYLIPRPDAHTYKVFLNLKQPDGCINCQITVRLTVCFQMYIIVVIENEYTKNANHNTGSQVSESCKFWINEWRRLSDKNRQWECTQHLIRLKFIPSDVYQFWEWHFVQYSIYKNDMPTVLQYRTV